MAKLQRMLVRRIRVGRRSVKLPFRCEAPGVRRELDLHIVSNASGRLLLFSAYMREEQPREPQPLLDPSVPRGDSTIQMCGWCDRFLVDGEWVEVEEAAARLELFRREEMPAISHDICPNCSEMLMAA
jgi:hypothetical protein